MVKELEGLAKELVEDKRGGKYSGGDYKRIMLPVALFSITLNAMMFTVMSAAQLLNIKLSEGKVDISTLNIFIISLVIFILSICTLKHIKNKDIKERKKEKEVIRWRINKMHEIIQQLPKDSYQVGKIISNNLKDISCENVYQIGNTGKVIPMTAYLTNEDRLEEIGGLFQVKVDKKVETPIFEAVYISPEYEVQGEMYSGYYNGVLTIPSMDVIN